MVFYSGFSRVIRKQIEFFLINKLYYVNFVVFLIVYYRVEDVFFFY